MSNYNEFPLSILKKDFQAAFTTKREAVEFAKLKNAEPPIKNWRGWVVTYAGSYSNVCTTGRKFCVVSVTDDGELKVDFAQLQMVQSIEDKKRYKLLGYPDVVFVSKSNWYADVLVEEGIEDMPKIAKLIAEATAQGKESYIKHMEAARPSKQLIKSLVQTPWDKAREDGVV